MNNSSLYKSFGVALLLLLGIAIYMKRTTVAPKPLTFTQSASSTVSIQTESEKLGASSAPSAATVTSTSTASAPTAQAQQRAMPGTTDEDRKKLMQSVLGRSQMPPPMEQMFASEAAARSAMKEQSDCMARAKGFTVENMGPQGSHNLTPEQRAAIAELPNQIQAGCLTTGKMLVQKYPSLRREFETNVLSKADPKAVKLWLRHSKE